MLIILCVEGIYNLKTTIKPCINSSTMQYHTASRSAASALFAIQFRLIIIIQHHTIIDGQKILRAYKCVFSFTYCHVVFK